MVGLKEEMVGKENLPEAELVNQRAYIDRSIKVTKELPRNRPGCLRLVCVVGEGTFWAFPEWSVGDESRQKEGSSWRSAC